MDAGAVQRLMVRANEHVGAALTAVNHFDHADEASRSNFVQMTIAQDQTARARDIMHRAAAAAGDEGTGLAQMHQELVSAHRNATMALEDIANHGNFNTLPDDIPNARRSLTSVSTALQDAIQAQRSLRMSPGGIALAGAGIAGAAVAGYLMLQRD